jgi:hypothetical protein
MDIKIPCPRGQRYNETYMYVQKIAHLTKLEGSWNRVLLKNFVFLLLYRTLRLVGRISFFELGENRKGEIGSTSDDETIFTT